MGTVHVINQYGKPVVGATVIVFVTQAFYQLLGGGGTLTSNTDGDGNAHFDNVDPVFFSGSTADIHVKYTDLNGVTVYGQDSWTIGIAGDWIPGTITVTLTEAEDPTFNEVQNVASSQVKTVEQGGAVGNTANLGLNTIILIIAVALGGYLFITLILPELKKPKAK